MNKINYKLINFTIIVFILFLFLQTKVIWLELFSLIKKIISPIIIAFLLAYFLTPLKNMIKSLFKNNKVAISITIIVLLILLFFLFYFSLPLIVTQLKDILSKVIPFIDKLLTKIKLDNYLLKDELLKNNLNKIITLLSKNTIFILINSISFSTNCFIVFILTIYLLFNMEKIKLKITKLFFKKEKLLLCLKNIDKNLNKYLYSLYLIVFIETIEYTFVYFVIGHPNYLLLGLLTSVANFIPYVGSFITSLVALVTASLISKKLFISCSLIIIILPIFDSYLIDPKIYHKTIKITPLKTIIAMFVFEKIFGFIGLLLAIPCLIVEEEVFKIYFKIRL